MLVRTAGNPPRSHTARSSLASGFALRLPFRQFLFEMGCVHGFITRK